MTDPRYLGSATVESWLRDSAEFWRDLHKTTTAIIEQQAADIAQLQSDREEMLHEIWLLKDKNRDLTREVDRLLPAMCALASLTPGGSEFATAEACVAYVRERRVEGSNAKIRAIRFARERDEQTARADAAESALAKCREALAFYADPGRYLPDAYDNEIEEDRGKRARVALAASQDAVPSHPTASRDWRAP